MNVPKAWIQNIYLLLLIGELYANIDSKEFFCGKKLTRTLTELCSIYNNPTFVSGRFRRQIVDECCRSQCSRRYLVQYYCLEANSSIAHLLKSKPESSSKTAHEKNTKKYQFDHPAAGSTQENSLTVGSNNEKNTNQAFLQKNKLLTSNHDRITHGKRNCKCRKRRAKRVKKMRRLQSTRNMINTRPVPPANIGHVEHSQKPFYIWRFSKI